MNRVDMIRALVRPFCVVWSVIMISVLAMRAMSGESIAPDSVGADCVYALLAISGSVALEWTGERGIANIITLIKKLRAR